MNVLIDRLFLLDHFFSNLSSIHTSRFGRVYITRKTYKIQDRSHQHNGTSSYYVLVIIIATNCLCILGTHRFAYFSLLYYYFF